MPDRLTLQQGQLTLTTEEGTTLEQSEAELEEMFRARFTPPLAGRAFPDGVKFVEWRDGRMVVVHQTPPSLRRMKWIAADSPAPYGPGTTYRPVELSLPYVLTFAVFNASGGGLRLSRTNELYFRNEPLRSREDRLCFPALLNVSCVQRGSRLATWICTAQLRLRPELDWTEQLSELLQHLFHSGSNRSSEHHEGASWYGESAAIEGLHPVEEWQRRSREDATFGLSTAWRPAPLSVGELIDVLLEPAQPGSPPSAANGFQLIPRFLNFLQSRRKPK